LKEAYFYEEGRGEWKERRQGGKGKG